MRKLIAETRRLLNRPGASVGRAMPRPDHRKPSRDGENETIQLPRTSRPNQLRRRTGLAIAAPIGVGRTAPGEAAVLAAAFAATIAGSRALGAGLSAVDGAAIEIAGICTGLKSCGPMPAVMNFLDHSSSGLTT
jgi:hypothetical protein